MAMNAARNIVKVLAEGSDQGLVCSLTTLTGPLHAADVIAIHLIFHPTSKLAVSDLHVCVDLLQEQHVTDADILKPAAYAHSL